MDSDRKKRLCFDKEPFVEQFPFESISITRFVPVVDAKTPVDLKVQILKTSLAARFSYSYSRRIQFNTWRLNADN
jgi:hypothetical protein